MSAFRIPKLGLGAAQLGLKYGITNVSGAPDELGACNILNAAHLHNFTYIDTAPSYGNSDQVIRKFARVPQRSSVITKTPKCMTNVSLELSNYIDTFVDQLGYPLYACLVHDVRDLFFAGGEELLAELRRLRSLDKVLKIGVSVYSPDELERVLEIFVPDLVQVPASIADRRFIDGSILTSLKKCGTEIHARSVFLQGLLISHSLPSDHFFFPLREIRGQIVALSKLYSVSSIAICLAFLFERNIFDSVIVGATSPCEVEQLANGAYEASTIQRVMWPEHAPLSNQVLLPTEWPTKN